MFVQILYLSYQPHIPPARRLLDSGVSAPGRQQLVRAFKLCDESLLSSNEAVEELLRSILDQWQGYVQVRCCAAQRLLAVAAAAVGVVVVLLGRGGCKGTCR